MYIFNLWWLMTKLVVYNCIYKCLFGSFVIIIYACIRICKNVCQNNKVETFAESWCSIVRLLISFMLANLVIEQELNRTSPRVSSPLTS